MVNQAGTRLRCLCLRRYHFDQETGLFFVLFCFVCLFVCFVLFVCFLFLFLQYNRAGNIFSGEVNNKCPKMHQEQEIYFQER